MIYEAYDALEMQPKQLFKKKWVIFLAVIPQMAASKWHSKIMMIDHYTASIIAHYHASNIYFFIAAIFLDCTLGKPQIASLSHPGI